MNKEQLVAASRGVSGQHSRLLPISSPSSRRPRLRLHRPPPHTASRPLRDHLLRRQDDRAGGGHRRAHGRVRAREHPRDQGPGRDARCTRGGGARQDRQDRLPSGRAIRSSGPEPGWCSWSLPARRTSRSPRRRRSSRSVLGAPVLRVDDVGVAGLHRLLAAVDRLPKANVIVGVAGMEGALPRSSQASPPA